MSSEVAIRVENVSKRYHMRHPVTTDTEEETHELWALKDVSFEIKKGESVGIIGPNGSGKSTLLKILAGVTKPTSGKVEIFGRVASILDIGAGFHTELSGRENVFLNGQIHGFTKKEIAAKFDAIVEFSGIEKFIDEPVKNYSNGMYLRLAFSIMAHLDFDVYLLDEVLAVGDENFQNKSAECITKWKDEGRTLLIIYHDFNSIKNVINREIDILKFSGHSNISIAKNDSETAEEWDFVWNDNYLDRVCIPTDRLFRRGKITLSSKIILYITAASGSGLAASDIYTLADLEKVEGHFVIKLGFKLAVGRYIFQILQPLVNSHEVLDSCIVHVTQNHGTYFTFGQEVNSVIIV